MPNSIKIILINKKIHPLISRKDGGGEGYTYLNRNLRRWWLCSNVEDKQSDCQAQHKPPTYLYRNPGARIRPSERTIPPPPPSFLPVVPLFFIFLLLLIVIAAATNPVVNNDETVDAVVSSNNFFLMQEGVVWSAGGWVTWKGESGDVGVLVEEGCFGSSGGVESRLIFNVGVVSNIGTVCMGDGGRALHVVSTWVGVEHQGFLVFMTVFHSLNYR